MSMFRKVALTLGIIFLIGLVITLLTDTLYPFLNALWDWVFRTIFKIQTHHQVHLVKKTKFVLYIDNRLTMLALLNQK